MYPTLEEDIDCEVVVIGGGMSGALISHALMEQGLNTVVVEKREVGCGSTYTSTGLLQFQNEKSLTNCMNTFGKEKGVRLYKLCKQGVDELEKTMNSLVIDPHFRRRPSLYFASEQEDVAALKEEYEALNHHGFAVDYLNAEQLAAKYSFHKPGAIYSYEDAEVNPYRAVAALMQSSHHKGMRIYEHTEILRHTAEQDHIIFFTDKHRIRAHKAIIATGYETQRFKHNVNAELSSTFVVVTQRVDAAFPGWHERSLVWETARPYLYLRTTEDNRIVVGGLDENTTNVTQRDRMLPQKVKQLLKETEQLFPKLGRLRAEYAWVATFGSTYDSFPIFGEQEGFPHCYFDLGYGGNGAVYSSIAAQILTDLIMKGHHPDAHLFRFNR
jgi:glycine/D-amino acid oxidase-like deaminating enzyme